MKFQWEAIHNRPWVIEPLDGQRITGVLVTLWPSFLLDMKGDEAYEG